ncbi:hypothetical protein [Paludisphaera mucosa]|uniref:Uncharacterized protein n=1 Tax=Paludisphaera mucosa TaxID=3030827 RepID=A0ABT6FII4_9BACT|nr:hypothetical protein [Paludisphaera mucosa]MDG3007398.1 hypothetical protein [Paludisphaera mucosa]
MLTMKHKTLQSAMRWKWNVVQNMEGPEGARAQAEAFINSVGAEKVVSIAEDSRFFTVTVWYRE